MGTRERGSGPEKGGHTCFQRRRLGFLSESEETKGKVSVPRERILALPEEAEIGTGQGFLEGQRLLRACLARACRVGKGRELESVLKYPHQQKAQSHQKGT